jgi:hypothetical protein
MRQKMAPALDSNSSPPGSSDITTRDRRVEDIRLQMSFDQLHDNSPPQLSVREVRELDHMPSCHPVAGGPCPGELRWPDPAPCSAWKTAPDPVEDSASELVPSGSEGRASFSTF